MDIPYALSLLLESVTECFLSPLGLLLLAGAAVLQILMLWSTEGKSKWTVLIVSVALVLACPAAFLLIKEWSVAFLAGMTFPYTVVILSGDLIGTLIQKIWTKVRYS